ncbi:hypothetical protein BH10ACI2_BH10ACI2_02070 [soil metagenome]
MRTKILYILSFSVVAFGLACSQPAANTTSPPASQSSSASPKDGYYLSRGTVTKVNLELGSVEMDHEELVGLMPAMRMEFSARPKSLVDGIKVGDRVEFTIEYKGGTETIVNLSKAAQ